MMWSCPGGDVKMGGGCWRAGVHLDGTSCHERIGRCAVTSAEMAMEGNQG